MAESTATKRKLVLKMSVSVDGFVAGPNGEIDWIFRTMGSDSMEWIVNTLRGAGAHMMGGRTYYDMAAFWPVSDSPLRSANERHPQDHFFEERNQGRYTDGSHYAGARRCKSGSHCGAAWRHADGGGPAVLDRTHGSTRRSGGGSCPTEGTAGQFHPGAWRRSVRPKPRCHRTHRRISTGHSSGCTGPRPTAFSALRRPVDLQTNQRDPLRLGRRGSPLPAGMKRRARTPRMTHRDSGRRARTKIVPQSAPARHTVGLRRNEIRHGRSVI